MSSVSWHCNGKFREKIRDIHYIPILIETTRVCVLILLLLTLVLHGIATETKQGIALLFCIYKRIMKSRISGLRERRS